MFLCRRMGPSIVAIDPTHFASILLPFLAFKIVIAPRRLHGADPFFMAPIIKTEQKIKNTMATVHAITTPARAINANAD